MPMKVASPTVSKIQRAAVGDLAEGGPGRAQPAEDQAAMIERPSTRGQGDGDAADGDGEEADEPAQEDAHPHEDHVGGRRGAVGVADDPGRPAPRREVSRPGSGGGRRARARVLPSKGISWPARTSRWSTMPRPLSRARSAQRLAGHLRRVTTTSRCAYGKSRSSRSSTSVPEPGEAPDQHRRGGPRWRGRPRRGPRVSGVGSATTPSRRIRSTKSAARGSSPRSRRRSGPDGPPRETRMARVSHSPYAEVTPGSGGRLPGQLRSRGPGPPCGGRPP